jgi:hypothetical protein
VRGNYQAEERSTVVVFAPLESQKIRGNQMVPSGPIFVFQRGEYLRLQFDSLILRQGVSGARCGRARIAERWNQRREGDQGCKLHQGLLILYAASWNRSCRMQALVNIISIGSLATRSHRTRR